MGFNIGPQVQVEVSQITESHWVNKFIRYLGFSISKNIDDLLSYNLDEINLKAEQDLKHWTKLNLSWLGRTTTLKM